MARPTAGRGGKVIPLVAVVSPGYIKSSQPAMNTPAESSSPVVFTSHCSGTTAFAIDFNCTRGHLSGVSPVLRSARQGTTCEKQFFASVCPQPFLLLVTDSRVVRSRDGLVNGASGSLLPPSRPPSLNLPKTGNPVRNRPQSPGTRPQYFRGCCAVRTKKVHKTFVSCSSMGCARAHGKRCGSAVHHVFAPGNGSPSISPISFGDGTMGRGDGQRGAPT
ncbi:hypothetical protein P154DRAFT_560466 [Amniculicola lignicola CBS 123094]|uniref:Uncharacterized protein n=1 Tax=Amniculicola lignicola CBS 123094 TaxID=1392246 RepID=A0A6A5WZZ8_9PLEO|nr:hypothetical protein P154DRAFT_560466 [Amniculicola lignicola CBS 123094]